MRPSPLFSKIDTGQDCYVTSQASYKGVAAKTFFLLGISVIVAIMTAVFLPQMLISNYSGFLVVLGISAVIGFVCVMIGRISQKASKYCGAIYAICEGLFLGTLSGLIELIYPGVATLAVFSTLIIFAVVLTLFTTGIIRVTSLFVKVMFVLSFSVIALLLFCSIYSLIAGPITDFGVLIAIEGFLVIYGAITLTLNFQEAQSVVNSGCDKSAEWCVALGLMVSLVYIYVELLRFIALIASRKD